MKEIRAAARERMKGHCRVCPVCDGKACSGEVPGMGGLGTGASFRNNREALNACKLNMTALHDAREPRTNCTILGVTILNIDNGYDFAESIVCAAGAGIGFLVAMVLFSGVRRRVEEAVTPKCFEGLPITVVAAAVTSLSFMGFGGIVESIFGA